MKRKIHSGNVREEDKHKNVIDINNDRYKDGVMDKSILGNKSQGIIRIINNDLGIKKHKTF